VGGETLDSKTSRWGVRGLRFGGVGGFRRQKRLSFLKRGCRWLGWVCLGSEKGATGRSSVRATNGGMTSVRGIWLRQIDPPWGGRVGVSGDAFRVK